MVEAADLGDRDDATDGVRGGRPRVRSILLEGEVGSGLVVIGEVAGEDAAQVPLAEHEDVVQTFAADRLREA